VSLCEHPSTHKTSSEDLPDKRQFLQHLLSKGSEVIAVGVPGIPVSENAHNLRNTWWLPCTIHVRSETGKTIERVDKDYSYYFEHVRTWSFYALRTWCDEEDYSEYDLSLICRYAHHLKVTMTPIAQTRFQKPIAFTLHFFAFPHADSSPGSMLGAGTVIWLPPATEISPYEAINLILKERYGLCLETISPSWVEVYKLPAQLPIEKEIEHLRLEISERDKHLRDALERLGSATRFRKLLYEQGEDGLEPVVRDAFRELGAKVEGPKRKGHEDGRFTDPKGRKAILEIKGRSGSLKLADVRQLDQWVRDAIAEEDYNSKGILVTNAHCLEEPAKRGRAFPHNCIKTAARFGLCLVTTTQLFRAICLKQSGKLDVTDFWNTLLTAEGACDLPELDSE
jgi:hypothetical protein